MKHKLLIDFLKVLALFGGLWVAFTFIPWVPDEIDLEFPVDKEIELGEMIMESTLKKQGFHPLENHLVDSAIWVIYKRLEDSLGLSHFDYRIVVVDNPSVNAFAMPGGNIVVLSGLVAFSESPEEVAAVIAHEMGHVELRHVTKRLVKELGLAVLFGVLTGTDGVVLSEMSRMLTSSYFDRRQEDEADEFALDLVYRCGINPKALGTLFRRMKSEYGSAEMFEIISTHPATSSRIKKSFEFEIGDDFESRPFSFDWEAVRAAAKAKES